MFNYYFLITSKQFLQLSETLTTHAALGLELGQGKIEFFYWIRERYISPNSPGIWLHTCCSTSKSAVGWQNPQRPPHLADTTVPSLDLTNSRIATPGGDPTCCQRTVGFILNPVPDKLILKCPRRHGP